MCVKPQHHIKNRYRLIGSPLTIIRSQVFIQQVKRTTKGFKTTTQNAVNTLTAANTSLTVILKH